MTTRNIEDIDKLFREGLNPEGDPVPYQEADWLKLQHRLARHEKRKRGIFWISRLSGVAALILLFFVIRMFIPESQQNIQQVEVVQKKPEVKPEVKKEHNPSNVSSEAKEMATKTEPGSNKSLAQNKNKEGKRAVKSKMATLVEKETSAVDSTRWNNLSAREATTAPAVNSTENNPSQPEIMKPPATTPSLPQVVKSPDGKRSSAEEPVYAVIKDSDEQPVTERPVRKLVLSLLAAPDYNGVNNMNNASLGNNFGLLVSVAIAKNWRFSTGGIYAKKLYESGFKDYTPSKNIWSEYYPTSVNADCRVLDIPLNISYTVLRLKNTIIGIGSGISSYIMLREDYRFTYPVNENNTPSTYQVVNENQHWLSVVNLQASIDQRLSSRLSIGLQPYMKIPLQDIGFAGVKLQSLGMAVNLGYNFNL